MWVGGGMGGRGPAPNAQRALGSKARPGKCRWVADGFIGRMQQVEDHMNSAACAAIGGQGLMGLAKELRNWCEELKRRQGERLPK